MLYMTEGLAEKTEKIQLEGIIEKDKVIISNKKGFEEFYNTSYIGTIEKNSDGQEVLTLGPIEVLLLCERHRLLIWEDNKKNKKYQRLFRMDRSLPNEKWLHRNNDAPGHSLVSVFDTRC